VTHETGGSTRKRPATDPALAENSRTVLEKNTRV
jgi:hypothetical protein